MPGERALPGGKEIRTTSRSALSTQRRRCAFLLTISPYFLRAGRNQLRKGNHLEGSLLIVYFLYFKDFL